jgi:hypothetical protein
MKPRRKRGIQLSTAKVVVGKKASPRRK